MADWANLKRYSSFGPPLGLSFISVTMLLRLMHLLSYRWAIGMLLLVAAFETGLMIYNRKHRSRAS